MALEFAGNIQPRYYARPAVFSCQVGAAAITAFPASAAVVGAQASGTISFSANPADGHTVNVNGTLITFKTTGGFSVGNQVLNGPWRGAAGIEMLTDYGPTGYQCAIGTTVQHTIANLLALLRGLPDFNLRALHFRQEGATTIRVLNGTTGTGGNSVTLAASNATVSGATLAGGTAPTAGYDVLVEPQAHPVELQAVWGICRASQTGGTITLLMSDGTNLRKADALTFPSGATLSASQELGRLSFSNIAAATPLLVPALWGLYAYGSTTQIIDIVTGAGGVY